MRLHKVKEERAHLRGTAWGVGDEDPSPVDGIYDVSTISIDSRRETVAFKVAGVGPSQIENPYSVTTLEAARPTGLLGLGPGVFAEKRS